MKKLHIIGGGLAGSEAAYAAANAGTQVILYEMRPQKLTPAHKSGRLAELVCSNSFRSDDAENNAVGLLHAEMRLAHSLVMQAADTHQIPAGGALAVDRDGFADAVSAAVQSHPNITLCHEEADAALLDKAEQAGEPVIIATGPLTSPAMAAAIQGLTGHDSLAFYDAIAPIIYKDSINMDIAWFQSRYDKTGPGGTGKDYLNCPMNKEQYLAFVAALRGGEKVAFHEFEEAAYFDGCLPIEVMAERGEETLRHGPMKPRGLTNTHKPEEKPYAVVQLRQDNKLGTVYNMVGFQTKLKYGAQTEIFRRIPGLEQAEFARLGGLHRNTYLNSPQLLDESLRLKARPHIRFAGQITGCEGYVESAAMGLLAGRLAAADLSGGRLILPPAETAFGALLRHITGGHIEAETAESEAAENEAEYEADKILPAAAGGKKPRSFQPMNINFGLFPQVSAPAEDGRRLRGKEKTLAKRRAITARALAQCKIWLAEQETAAKS